MLKIETSETEVVALNQTIKTEPPDNLTPMPILKEEVWPPCCDIRAMPFRPPTIQPFNRTQFQFCPQQFSNSFRPHPYHPWPPYRPYQFVPPAYPQSIHNYNRFPALQTTYRAEFHRSPVSGVACYPTLPTRLSDYPNLVNERFVPNFMNNTITIFGDHSIPNLADQKMTNAARQRISNVAVQRMNMSEQEMNSVDQKSSTAIDQRTNVAVQRPTNSLVQREGNNDETQKLIDDSHLSHGGAKKKSNTFTAIRRENFVRNRHYTFDSLEIGKFCFRTYIKPNKHTKIRLLFNLRILVYDFRYNYKVNDANEKIPLLVLIVIPIDTIVSVDVHGSSVTLYLCEAAKIFTAVDPTVLKNRISNGQTTIDITKGEISCTFRHTFTMLRPFGDMLKKCFTEYNPKFEISVDDNVKPVVKRLIRVHFIRPALSLNKSGRVVLRSERKRDSPEKPICCSQVTSAITKCEPEQSSNYRSVDNFSPTLNAQYTNLINVSDKDEDNKFLIVD